MRGTLQDADEPRRSLSWEKRDRSNREREADFRPAGFATYDQPYEKREFRGEREEEEKKEIGKTSKMYMGRRKRQAEKRGCPCSLRFFVVHNGKRGKRKTRDITLYDNDIESRELYCKSSRTRLAVHRRTRLFQSAINEDIGCRIIISPLTRFSGKLFLAQFDFRA